MEDIFEVEENEVWKKIKRFIFLFICHNFSLVNGKWGGRGIHTIFILDEWLMCVFFALNPLCIRVNHILFLWLRQKCFQPPINWTTKWLKIERERGKKKMFLKFAWWCVSMRMVNPEAKNWNTFVFSPFHFSKNAKCENDLNERDNSKWCVSDDKD